MAGLRRHPARPGGRGSARPGLPRPGGPQTARRDEPRVRRIRPDGRIPPRAEIAGAGDARCSPGRAVLGRAHGDGGDPRRRHRRRRGHRPPHGLRPHRHRPGPAPARHGVRDRAPQVLRSPGQGGRGAGRFDLRREPPAATAPHRRAPVLAGHRGGDHAAAPAGGGDHQPGHGSTAPRPQARPGEADGGDRGPRQHRGPVHRQDGHPDRGQDHVRTRLRHDRSRIEAGVRTGPACHRERRRGRWEPPRRGPVGGRQRVHPAPAAGAGHPAVRPRTPDDLGPGRGPGRGRPAPGDEGRARGGAGAVRRRAGLRGEGHRPGVRLGLAGGRGGLAPRRGPPGHRGARRKGPPPGGRVGLPGPPEGQRGRRAGTAGPARHHGEGRHRRQRGGGPQGLHRSRPGRRRDPHRPPDRRHGRRRAGEGPGHHDRVRPGHPGGQGPPDQASAGHRGGRGLPRRRGERRRGPARRRRRYLGRLRRRRGQGRRRHRAAGEGPGRAGRGGGGGPAHLLQHHQVRADGNVVELRQHVQRGGRLGLPEVPADAAVPDPAEQPALRSAC